MIARLTIMGVKMLNVMQCKDGNMRLLLVLGFSEDASYAPFKAACDDALQEEFWDGGGIIVCAKVAAITFRLFCYGLPETLASDCSRRRLIVRNTSGTDFSFEGRVFRVDNEEDRKRLDVVFRLMQREVTQRGFTHGGRRISSESFWP